ncbi:hypothetical protein COLO4_00183 [Corchorus olitorius]|uniref:Uncharacterized protein n=1 Tax=Corchorus olitorius TaxID=93759 RepID=A0A1R3L4D9_9ROSI|nr:hypothetical protein COLO4_00183 [Corchorus olitorius]
MAANNQSKANLKEEELTPIRQPLIGSNYASKATSAAPTYKEDSRSAIDNQAQTKGKRDN